MQPVGVQLAVMGQRVGGGVGRAEQLDAEALEQGTRGKLRARQLCLQVVVDGLGTAAVQPFLHAKEVDQLIRQPEAGRRGAEEVKVLGEALPDAAVVGLDWRANAGRHAQLLQRQALAVEHAQDIVVRHDEELGRCAKASRRIGQQASRHMAVRADQRQIFDPFVEYPRNGALCGVWGKTAIGRNQPRNTRHLIILSDLKPGVSFVPSRLPVKSFHRKARRHEGNLWRLQPHFHCSLCPQMGMDTVLSLVDTVFAGETHAIVVLNSRWKPGIIHQIWNRTRQQRLKLQPSKPLPTPKPLRPSGTASSPPRRR